MFLDELDQHGPLLQALISDIILYLSAHWMRIDQQSCDILLHKIVKWFMYPSVRFPRNFFSAVWHELLHLPEYIV